MQGALGRILTGFFFFSATVLIAVVGYVGFGWSLLEAIYMVTITIFGVGYGEVKPLITPFEKIFTILVIIAGTSSAVYIVGGFVQMVTEGEINRALDARRKERSLASLHNHTVICGFDRMGQVLARQLHDAEESFAIIDPHFDPSTANPDYLVCPGHPTDEAVLLAAGIERARALVTVLADDATNVFITLTARELNPNLTIVARGQLPTTEKKLRLAGADRVVLPDTIGAVHIANLLTRPTGADFLSQPDERSYLNELLSQIDVQMEELTLSASSPLVDKSIRELEVRSKGAFIVVALRRASGTLQLRPNPSQLVGVGDTLIAIGHRGDLMQYARRYLGDRSLEARRPKT